MGESPWKFESSRPHQTVFRQNEFSPSGGQSARSGAVLRPSRPLVSATEVRRRWHIANFPQLFARSLRSQKARLNRAGAGSQLGEGFLGQAEQLVLLAPARRGRHFQQMLAIESIR